MPSLKTTAAGTVTLTATIVNGLSPTSNYTQDFNVTFIVPVTGITGIPGGVSVGVDLTLAGTVAPTNATNKTIVWSVKNAGTTGATVSGNVLKTTAAGTLVLTATITNGKTASTNYTQDFTITVSSNHVAATGITGVPTEGIAGVDISLTGTVAPTNATNKTIVWTVKSAGTTGATIV